MTDLQEIRQRLGMLPTEEAAAAPKAPTRKQKTARHDVATPSRRSSRLDGGVVATLFWPVPTHKLRTAVMTYAGEGKGLLASHRINGIYVDAASLLREIGNIVLGEWERSAGHGEDAGRSEDLWRNCRDFSWPNFGSKEVLHLNMVHRSCIAGIFVDPGMGAHSVVASVR
ncbi:hypothetical protein MMC18_008784 [Xylographa bjoerkii]|nr:hypothetical protein [Xylographa bjoerkii]